MFSNNFGTFYVKLMCILFGQLMEKIGLLFIATSGRTVPS